MCVQHLDGGINTGDFIVTKSNKIIEVKAFDRTGNIFYARGCVYYFTNLKRFMDVKVSSCQHMRTFFLRQTIMV